MAGRRDRHAAHSGTAARLDRPVEHRSPAPHSNGFAPEGIEPKGIEEGPQPKHTQLREILRHRVEYELPPGAPIPSERELADVYGVSRLTVRAAVGRLVDEGLLARVPGKGTFTVGRRVNAQLHFESFTEELSRRGYRTSTEVLAAERRPLDDGAASGLGLRPGADGLFVSRLRRADGVPLAVESGWYNPERVPGLLAMELTGSLYAQLAADCGVVLDHANQTIRAEAAQGRTAALLEVPTGSSLLVLHRIASAAGVAVEDMTSAYRGDLYQLTMQMDRSNPVVPQTLSPGGSR